MAYYSTRKSVSSASLMNNTRSNLISSSSVNNRNLDASSSAKQKEENLSFSSLLSINRIDNSDSSAKKQVIKKSKSNNAFQSSKKINENVKLEPSNRFEFLYTCNNNNNNDNVSIDASNCVNASKRKDKILKKFLNKKNKNTNTTFSLIPNKNSKSVHILNDHDGNYLCFLSACLKVHKFK